jgi:hypothetical protein
VGPQGPAGVSGIHQVSAVSEHVTIGQHSVVVFCPDGEDVLGAGYVVRQHRGTNFQTGSDAVTIDWVRAQNKVTEDFERGFATGEVLFTVYSTRLPADSTITVEVLATCAAIG